MNNKKKICILSCLMGMEDSHSNFYADVISSSGYPLLLICPGVIPESLAGRDVIHIPIPLPTHHFDYASKFDNVISGLWQRFRNSVMVYRKLMELKPDIVFCSQPDSWWLAVRAKRRLHNIVIVDLKEIYEDRASAFPKFMQTIVRRMIRSSLRLLAKSADEIIHVSPARQEFYRYLNKPGEIISIFPDLTTQFQKRDEKNSARIEIIHAGGLRWSYGSDQLLEAISLVFEQRPEVHFTVFGNTRSELKNAVLCRLLINDGILEIIPNISHDELMKRLPDYDIGLNLVLPIDQTHILAMPRKLFEYLATGIPVIAAEVPTVRKIINENDCGILVDPFSPRSIADGILSLVDNPSARRKMGINGRKAAELYFNAASEREKIQRLIERYNSNCDQCDK